MLSPSTSAPYVPSDYIKALVPTPNAEFGERVSVSRDGRTVLIGAAPHSGGIPNAPVNPPDQSDVSVPAAGGAFIFTRTVITSTFSTSANGTTTLFGNVQLTPTSVLVISVNGTLNVTGQLDISPGASLSFSVPVGFVGGKVVVSAASIRGTFASVTEQSPMCSSLEYSSTTLTVVTQQCGLSNGALIGIIAGSVVGGILLAAAIVVITLVARNAYTKQANLDIARNGGGVGHVPLK